jgi:hypothetical protein
MAIGIGFAFHLVDVGGGVARRRRLQDIRAVAPLAGPPDFAQTIHEATDDFSSLVLTPRFGASRLVSKNTVANLSQGRTAQTAGVQGSV